MSKNKNGDKGYRWEKACVDFLNDQGHSVRRQKVRGGGDLSPLRVWSLECKDDASKSDRATAEQAARQALVDGRAFGVVLKKTRGKNAQSATVHMTVETWLQLVDYVEALSNEFLTPTEVE